MQRFRFNFAFALAEIFCRVDSMQLSRRQHSYSCFTCVWSRAWHAKNSQARDLDEETVSLQSPPEREAVSLSLCQTCSGRFEQKVDTFWHGAKGTFIGSLCSRHRHVEAKRVWIKSCFVGLLHGWRFCGQIVKTKPTSVCEVLCSQHSFGI